MGVRAGGPHQSGPKVFRLPAGRGAFEPLFLDVYSRNRLKKRERLLRFRTRASGRKSRKIRRTPAAIASCAA